MSTYVIHSSNPTMVLRDGYISIPIGNDNRDENNPEYKEYLKWVSAGNVAPLIDPPAKPLTARLRGELLAQGVTMEAKVNALWALIVDEDPKLVDELRKKIETELKKIDKELAFFYEHHLPNLRRL